MTARALALPLVLALLALDACGGGSDTDDASAAACRGLAVVDASLRAIEASTTDDTFQNADSATFTSAVAHVGALVGSPGVSNDLAVPVGHLAGAYGAMGHALEVGLTDDFTRATVADRGAWSQVVEACKPYVSLGR